MLLKLILLFTIIPFIELIFLIEVGSRIGTLNTVMLVVVTGIVGAFMARIAGFQVLFKIQQNLRTGVFPKDELFDSVLILIAGALLITPGLLTDALGFFLLLPSGRAMIKKWLKEIIREKIDQGEISLWRDGF